MVLECQILSFESNVLITLLSRQLCELAQNDVVAYIRLNNDYNNVLIYKAKSKII